MPQRKYRKIFFLKYFIINFARSEAHITGTVSWMSSNAANQSADVSSITHDQQTNDAHEDSITGSSLTSASVSSSQQNPRTFLDGVNLPSIGESEELDDLAEDGVLLDLEDEAFRERCIENAALAESNDLREDASLPKRQAQNYDPEFKLPEDATPKFDDMAKLGLNPSSFSKDFIQIKNEDGNWCNITKTGMKIVPRDTDGTRTVTVELVNGKYETFSFNYNETTPVKPQAGTGPHFEKGEGCGANIGMQYQDKLSIKKLKELGMKKSWKRDPMAFVLMLAPITDFEFDDGSKMKNYFLDTAKFTRMYAAKNVSSDIGKFGGKTRQIFVDSIMKFLGIITHSGGC